MLGSSGDVACPTWFVHPNGSSECSCADTVGGVVRCADDDQIASVVRCYCITFDPDERLSVSPCLFTCSVTGGMDFVPLPMNVSEVNDAVCGRFNRKGALCGQCIEGHEVTAFSINLECVPCMDSNWLQYFAMTLLPLTAFFIVVVVLRFRATSAWLDAYIFSQIITSPAISRLYLYDASVRFTELTSAAPVLSQVTHSLYGIWNLNFFQALVPPFCIAPGFETLYVFALDFIIVSYPLFLVLVTFVLVELHARNFKPLVVLWKPFRRIFIRFHNQVSAKNSIMDVFATFILLSYVKLVNVSSDLLHFTKPQFPDGTQGPPRWIHNGTVGILEGKHIPFGILAILGFSFVTLILIFLFLYPCKLCQAKVMSHLPWPQIREFVDCFQGHYKDGTNGTRDFRYFSALYLLLRIVHLAIAEFLLFGFVVPIGGMVILLFAMLTFVLQPYRQRVHNTCNGVILLVMGGWITVLALYQFPLASVRGYFLVAVILESLVCLVPFVYFVALLVVFTVIKWRNFFPSKSAASSPSRTSRRVEGGEGNGEVVASDTSYPDRVSHPERYNSMVLGSSTSGHGGRKKSIERTLIEAAALQAALHHSVPTPTEGELNLGEAVAAAIPIEVWKLDNSRDHIATPTSSTEVAVEAAAASHTPATPTTEVYPGIDAASPTRGSKYDLGTSLTHTPSELTTSPAQGSKYDLGTSPTHTPSPTELKCDLGAVVQFTEDSDSDPEYFHLQEVTVDGESETKFNSRYNLWS